MTEKNSDQGGARISHVTLNNLFLCREIRSPIPTAGSRSGLAAQPLEQRSFSEATVRSFCAPSHVIQTVIGALTGFWYKKAKCFNHNLPFPVTFCRPSLNFRRHHYCRLNLPFLAWTLRLSCKSQLPLVDYFVYFLPLDFSATHLRPRVQLATLLSVGINLIFWPCQPSSLWRSRRTACIRLIESCSRKYSKTFKS